MNPVCIDCPMYDTAGCIDCSAHKGDDRDDYDKDYDPTDWEHEEDDGGDE